MANDVTGREIARVLLNLEAPWLIEDEPTKGLEKELRKALISNQIFINIVCDLLEQLKQYTNIPYDYERNSAAITALRSIIKSIITQAQKEEEDD